MKLIKKEKFLLNKDGKVRNCDRNTANMNVWEYIYVDVIERKILSTVAKEIICEDLKELILSLLRFIANVVMFITFPATLIFKAKRSIRRAKKELERDSKVWGRSFQ